MIKTAVVILNWNGRELLGRFLPEVLQNSVSADTAVFVADNGSDDDSVAWMAENHPDVKVIVLGKNYGYAGGYNRALKQVEAEYYILLNSDVRVEKGWTETLTTYLEMHPRVGACQPKIRSLERPAFFEYAGAAGGYMDKFGYPFCRGRI
ncbi:MAG: glycosyltransferase, partial [Bacteroidales bacterium]|nr:glycosyltransferase [Bacteroidales bacterium]